MAVPNDGTTTLPSDGAGTPNFFLGWWDGAAFWAPRADNSAAKNLRVARYDANGNPFGVVSNPEFVRLSDGTSALVGQKAMAASIPVVIASDQAAVPVSGTVALSGTVDVSDRSGRLVGVVNQGVAAAVAGAWPQSITDGTNGPVAVKPAFSNTGSFAYVSVLDPSVVVSVSPNTKVLVGGELLSETRRHNLLLTRILKQLQLLNITLGGDSETPGDDDDVDD